MSWKQEISEIIGRQDENGGPYWSRADGNIHAPAGFSTIDVMHAIGQLGGKVEDSPVLKEAVEFLLGYQNDDGSFRYGTQKSKLPCITANVLSVLGRLSLPNSASIDKSYSWLLDNQAADGGWRCATVKLGKAPETDASNPGTTLWVLDAFLFKNGMKRHVDALNSGVDFLLDHWSSRKPLGPCNFGIGGRFLKTEFPFRRYNLFYYVYVLSQYESARNDKRLHEAFEALKPYTDSGHLSVASPHRAWKGAVFAPQTGPSEPASKYWKEIVKRLG
ncbi:prenyltransferase/squalene oxidase repeat-containing protein [Maritalea myrionectae]|nr:prenyltransferase/squalene oxidase repeat-containing protein [Maritalea myrionectae]